MPDIRELRDLYETADVFAREVSELRSEVPIPAHNELRYAGHHLLQSINDEGEVADEDLFRKAKNHCERAMYEAAEAGIMHILEAVAGRTSSHQAAATGNASVQPRNSPTWGSKP